MNEEANEKLKLYIKANHNETFLNLKLYFINNKHLSNLKSLNCNSKKIFTIKFINKNNI